MDKLLIIDRHNRMLISMDNTDDEIDWQILVDKSVEITEARDCMVIKLKEESRILPGQGILVPIKLNQIYMPVAQHKTSMVSQSKVPNSNNKKSQILKKSDTLKQLLDKIYSK